ncbi:hypothetical protein [Streptomyces noursei]|uniref:hypothetical protein n=1 Tax=Streptomyces noursei TaxID=1971 RepID=UPI0030F010EE
MEITMGVGGMQVAGAQVDDAAGRAQRVRVGVRREASRNMPWADLACVSIDLMPEVDIAQRRSRLSSLSV